MLTRIKKWLTPVPWLESLLVLNDVIPVVLCFCLGIVIATDLYHKQQGWALFHVFIAGALICGVSFSHLMRRRALESHKHLRDAMNALKDKHKKLMDVAMSAMALKLMIEHGFPPNLHALSRDLDAVMRVEKVEVEVVQQGPMPRGPADKSTMN